MVASLAAALRRLVAVGGFERVLLFGHSGGGVLAVLLAPRVPETAGLVTVAANLDIDRWADLHGYPRLHQSLNPARQPPLRWPADRERCRFSPIMVTHAAGARMLVA